MLRRGMILLIVFGGLLATGAWAQEKAEKTQPPIYKWVDENGIAHYTTDLEHIPEALRDRIRGIRFRRREEAPPERVSEPWVLQDVPPPGPSGDEEATDTSTSAGPSGDEEATDADTSAGPSSLEREIAEVEARIALEEERIKALISQPSDARSTGLPDDPEFRAAARRLPELQARLRELRAQRSRAEPATP